MYMGAGLSPVLLDHPAIYKTSWRAGETIALVYNYAKTCENMFSLYVALLLWYSGVFGHLTQVMNKPISYVFMFSVVYCVVFRQKPICFMFYVCLFYVVVYFSLVFWSFYIYNRTVHITTETTHIKRFEEHINNKIINKKTVKTQTDTLFPSRNLRDIYSRSGPGLDILYLCCLCVSRNWYVLFMLLFCLCFVFSPSLLKLLHLQSN